MKSPAWKEAVTGWSCSGRITTAMRLDDDLLVVITVEIATEAALAAHFEVRRGDVLLAVISYVTVRDGCRSRLPEEIRRLVPQAVSDG